MQFDHKKNTKIRVDFSEFFVEDESDNYRLQVSGYNGTAGERLKYHNGLQFTTADRDNDNFSNYYAG